MNHALFTTTHDCLCGEAWRGQIGFVYLVRIKVMNKVEIKKAVGKIQDELTKYGLMTPANGIDFPVSIMVEKVENKTGKMVPHIVAKWKETTVVSYGYDVMPTGKAEELNKYFDAAVFVNGITQRAEWIKAEFEDCVAYLEDNPFAHPALFNK